LFNEKTRGRKSRVRVPFHAANSDPTSWKCGVVRGPHRCPKIPTDDRKGIWGKNMKKMKRRRKEEKREKKENRRKV
jgi:hypothetical protein